LSRQADRGCWGGVILSSNEEVIARPLLTFNSLLVGLQISHSDENETKTLCPRAKLLTWITLLETHYPVVQKGKNGVLANIPFEVRKFTVFDVVIDELTICDVASKNNTNSNSATFFEHLPETIFPR